MKTEYHADFLEAAIDACLAGHRKDLPPLMRSRFNLERERVYRLTDLDRREDAFQQLHLKWFREWGLADVLRKLADEALAPCASQLESLTYRKPRDRKDEGAELYADSAGVRRAVVALRGERFADDDDLAVFLRHELFHLVDMLDPAFGYAPALSMPALPSSAARTAGSGTTETQLRLATERYRVLWDAAIDGRLARACHGIATPREQHAALVAKAFSFWPPARCAAVLTEIWEARGITHARLAELSADPRADDAGAPAPGQPCPLCGMPAFDWAPPEALPPVAALIHSQFEFWTQAHGACTRCVEVYTAVTSSPEGLAALREARGNGATPAPTLSLDARA